MPTAALCVNFCFCFCPTMCHYFLLQMRLLLKKNQYFCLIVKQSNSNKQNYFLVNNERKAPIDQKKN